MASVCLPVEPRVHLSGEWVPIEDTGIDGWHADMTLDTLPQTTRVLVCSEGESHRTDRQLWYTESRGFLLARGVEPLNALAHSGDDACMHHQLFWDERLYQPQTCRGVHFMGSNSPVLVTCERVGSSDGGDDKDDTDECRLTLWATNTVGHIRFRGWGIVKPKPKNQIRFVRAMYAARCET